MILLGLLYKLSTNENEWSFYYSFVVVVIHCRFALFFFGRLWQTNNASYCYKKSCSNDIVTVPYNRSHTNPILFSVTTIIIFPNVTNNLTNCEHLRMLYICAWVELLVELWTGYRQEQDDCVLPRRTVWSPFSLKSGTSLGTLIAVLLGVSCTRKPDRRLVR